MTTVSAITFQYVLKTLSGLTGISEEAMLEYAGLASGGMPAADSDVDSRCLSAVFRYCMEKTSNPDLALDMGQSVPYQSLGLLGYLLLNTSDLRQMIEKFNRYQLLVSKHLKFHFSVDGKFYKLAIYINENRNTPVPGFHAEVHLSAILSILTQILGQNVTPACTWFSQRRSAYRGRFREIFGDNVLFGREENAVFFRIDELNIPVSNANRAMLEFFEKQADSFLQRNEDKSWYGRVEKEILKNMGDGNINIRRIASVLNVGVRTLQNYLTNEDKSFSMALSVVRRRLAEYYISESDLRDTEIAGMLGYSEVSAFYRAYKKWNGSTPKILRKYK